MNNGKRTKVQRCLKKKMIGNSQKNYLWKTGADSQTDQTNEQRKQGSICLPMPMPANLTSKSAISKY